MRNRNKAKKLPRIAHMIMLHASTKAILSGSTEFIIRKKSNLIIT